MKARYMMTHKRGSFNEKCIKRNKRGHTVKYEDTTENKKTYCGSFKEIRKLPSKARLTKLFKIEGYS